MSADELARIYALIAGVPAVPPERIYGWLDSQLSIAKYYGGCRFQGHQYFIAPNEDRQPLVRADVLKREAKEQGDRLARRRRVRKVAIVAAQGGLL